MHRVSAASIKRHAAWTTSSVDGAANAGLPAVGIEAEVLMSRRATPSDSRSALFSCGSRSERKSTRASLLARRYQAQAWSRPRLRRPARRDRDLPLTQPLFEHSHPPAQQPIVFVELIDQAKCFVDA